MTATSKWVAPWGNSHRWATPTIFIGATDAIAEMKGKTLRVRDLTDYSGRAAVRDVDDAEKLYLSGAARNYLYASGSGRARHSRCELLRPECN